MSIERCPARATVVFLTIGYNVHLQDPTTFPFLRADLATAPHTSSCGHVMHARCWQKYFDDVSESERRRYRLAKNMS